MVGIGSQVFEQARLLCVRLPHITNTSSLLSSLASQLKCKNTSAPWGSAQHSLAKDFFHLTGQLLSFAASPPPIQRKEVWHEGKSTFLGANLHLGWNGTSSNVVGHTLS